MKRLCITLWIVLLLTSLGCQGSSAPLIGITSVYKVDDKGTARTQIHFNYAQAVAENGGIPFVLPTIDNEQIIQRYVKELDGLVLVAHPGHEDARYRTILPGYHLLRDGQRGGGPGVFRDITRGHGR